jgi:hypothetical protein
MGDGSLSMVGVEEVHMPSRITKLAVIATFVSIAIAPMRDGSLSIVDAEEVHNSSGSTEAVPSTKQSTREVHKPSENTMPAVIAAVASIIVAIISALISWHVSRQQHKVQRQIKDLDLTAQAKLKREELDEQAIRKREELDEQAKALAARLRMDQEGLRQVQLTEVLKKRIDTYPALYQIITVYGRNWEIQDKVRDSAWATLFLNALIDNNAGNGAFFSERVYRWYGLLRSLLENLTVALSTGREANEMEIELLYDIIRGPMLSEEIQALGTDINQAPGLGSYIKDELGSYIIAGVSSVFDSSAMYERPPYDANEIANDIEKSTLNNIKGRLQLLNKENNIHKS